MKLAVDVMSVLSRDAKHAACGRLAMFQDEHAARMNIEGEQARAAVAELVDATAELSRAITFMDDVRASNEETIATGIYRDAVEWIESAARRCVGACPRTGGAP